MKQIYIAFAAAAVALTATAAPRQFTKHQFGTPLQKKEAKAVIRKGARVETNAWFKPARQIQYTWEDGQWLPEAEFHDTFDPNGLINESVVKILAEEAGGQAQRTTYTYDQYGLETSNLLQVSYAEGVPFEDYSKRERTYDPVVHSLITSNLEYMSGTVVGEPEDWVQNGNNYRRTVSRNEDGNVTSTVVETLYMGRFEPVQQLLVEYGDDKKATNIKMLVLSYDENDEEIWETEAEYADIIWETTNGQIVDENITYGENRIKSCKVYDEDGENIVNVTYGENGSFRSVLTYAMGSIVADLKVLDEYGSEEYTALQTYTDEEGTYIFKEVERETYNLDGLQTEAYAAMGEAMGGGEVEIPDEELEIAAWMKADVEYNAPGGHTSLYTIKEYDFEAEDWANITKVEFFDYEDAAINSVAAPADAPAEYYNLQGRRISNPLPGTIVIRRQGSSATTLRL